MSEGEWTRREPTTVTKVGWRTIVTKTFEMPDGKITTFDTFHPEGYELANGVALTPDNEVIVAQQFRAGPEAIMTEIPGGIVDPGHTPAQTVVHELEQETGYKPGEVIDLGKPYFKDAYMNARFHPFLLLDCVQVGGQRLDTDEHIRTLKISLDELMRLAVNGQLTDQTTVFLAERKLRELGRI